MELEVLTWEEVVDATQRDPDIVKLIEIVDRGFPETSYEMPKELREFFQYRHELNSVDGALCDPLIPQGKYSIISPFCTSRHHWYDKQAE